MRESICYIKSTKSNYNVVTFNFLAKKIEEFSSVVNFSRSQTNWTTNTSYYSLIVITSVMNKMIFGYNTHTYWACNGTLQFKSFFIVSTLWSSSCRIKGGNLSFNENSRVLNRIMNKITRILDIDLWRLNCFKSENSFLN